jgi:NADH-quinone oxidoreductase subunit M
MLASIATSIAVLGLLFTAITFLRAMQQLFSGPLSDNCAAFPDLLRREKLVVVPVTLLLFAVGVAPQFLFNLFNGTVVQMARLFA